ncbi:MAG: flavin reductase family protein [Candidatus Binatia bacterium]|nr:flavin reductase family protein [Candidatus Binatia bacterium]
MTRLPPGREMDERTAGVWSALSTGIYILTTRAAGSGHGMSASWVTQASANPPLLIAAVGQGTYSHRWLVEQRWFGLNVVGQRSKSLQDYFHSASAKRVNNLDRVDWFWSPAGVPWLLAALLCLECKVVDSFAVGDRTAFVATVTAARWGAVDRPLTSLDLPYAYVGEIHPNMWYQRSG